MKMKILLTTLVISISILVSGCGNEDRGPAPENAGIAPVGNPIIGIVPSRGSSRVSYCKLNENKLVVTFANSGEIPSSGSVNVTVDFGVGNVVLPMPGIQPGDSVDMNFPIPNGCFSPDCSFSIKWSNQPPVSGICIG